MWALTKRERIGALVVDAIELEGHTYLMHRYQGSMVGEPRHVLENGLATSVLITISYSTF